MKLHRLAHLLRHVKLYLVFILQYVNVTLQKNCKHTDVLLIVCFITKVRLAILKLLSLCSGIKYMSKYIEENGSQVSHHWRRGLQYEKGDQNDPPKHRTKMKDVKTNSLFTVRDIKTNADVCIYECMNTGKCEYGQVYFLALYNKGG